MKHKVSGRPNHPKPTDLDEARSISDVASRPFTSMAKGVAMEQVPPQGAGRSVNPKDPFQYAKNRGRPMPDHPKVTA